MLSLNYLISRIIRHPFAVLARAGVSCPAPSNLPTAGMILNYLSATLAPSAAMKRRLRRLNHPPFEATMEFLSRAADPNLAFLSFLRECKSPNGFHHFLASCVTRNQPVITPNFDGLVEIAVKDLDFAPTVVATTAQFSDALRRPPSFPVWKIHGSYEDERGQNISSSIKATLASVTKSGLAFEWEPARLKVLKTLLSGRVLLIVGYSASDDLDIVPALRSISGLKGIVWVTHKDQVSLVVRQWDKTKSNNGERHFDFLKHGVFSKLPFGVFEVTGRTEKLVARLQNALDYPPAAVPYSDFTCDWKEQIFRWAKRHFRTSSSRWQWVAHVYAWNQQFERELRATRRALKFQRGGAELTRGYYNLGKCFAKLKRHQEAVGAFRKALLAADRTHALPLKAGILATMAAVETRLGRWAEASVHARRALAIARRNRTGAIDIATACYALAMLDVATGRLRRARSVLEATVLPVFQRAGDLRGYIYASEDLAHVERKLHLHDKALSTAERAISYAEGGHNPFELGYAHIFCAAVLCQAGKWREAKIHTSTTLKMAEAHRLEDLATRARRYLAWIYHAQRRYNDAVFFYEGIARYDSIHRSNEYPETLTNLADAYMKLHRTSEGLAMFRRAELAMTARGLEDEKAVLNKFAGLRCFEEGRRLRRRGKHPLASRLLRKALFYLNKAGQKEQIQECMNELVLVRAQ